MSGSMGIYLKIPKDFTGCVVDVPVHSAFLHLTHFHNSAIYTQY